jgi:hypothetical protein
MHAEARGRRPGAQRAPVSMPDEPPRFNELDFMDADGKFMEVQQQKMTGYRYDLLLAACARYASPRSLHALERAGGAEKAGEHRRSAAGRVGRASR